MKKIMSPSPHNRPKVLCTKGICMGRPCPKVSPMVSPVTADSAFWIFIVLCSANRKFPSVMRPTTPDGESFGETIGETFRQGLPIAKAFATGRFPYIMGRR